MQRARVRAARAAPGACQTSRGCVQVFPSALALLSVALRLWQAHVPGDSALPLASNADRTAARTFTRGALGAHTARTEALITQDCRVSGRRRSRSSARAASPRGVTPGVLGAALLLATASATPCCAQRVDAPSAPAAVSVATAAELEEALAAGVRHVQLVAHLEFRGDADTAAPGGGVAGGEGGASAETSGGLLPIPPTTFSLQVLPCRSPCSLQYRLAE
jgi:hypothetical protein